MTDLWDEDADWMRYETRIVGNGAALRKIEEDYDGTSHDYYGRPAKTRR